MYSEGSDSYLKFIQHGLIPCGNLFCGVGTPLMNNYNFRKYLYGYQTPAEIYSDGYEALRKLVKRVIYPGDVC